MVCVVQELAKCLLRLDQPTAALALYQDALAGPHPGCTDLLLGAARVHDALGATDAGVELYKQVRDRGWRMQCCGACAHRLLRAVTLLGCNCCWLQACMLKSSFVATTSPWI